MRDIQIIHGSVSLVVISSFTGTSYGAGGRGWGSCLNRFGYTVYFQIHHSWSCWKPHLEPWTNCSTIPEEELGDSAWKPLIGSIKKQGEGPRLLLFSWPICDYTVMTARYGRACWLVCGCTNMQREGGRFKSITRGMSFVPGTCLLKSEQRSPLPGIFPCDTDTSPTALQHSL